MTEATRQDAAPAGRSGRAYGLAGLAAIGLIGAAGFYFYEARHVPAPPAPGPSPSASSSASSSAAGNPAVPLRLAAQPALPPAAQPALPPAATQAGAPQPGAPQPGAPQPASPQPATLQPAAASHPAPPSVDVVRIDQDGSLVMAGSAQPGETLTIHNGVTLLGSVKADEDGQWVFLPDATLPAGVHQLSVAGPSAASKSAGVQTTVLLSLPGQGGGATASAPGGKLQSGPMVVLTQGDAPPRLLLAPPGSHPGPVGLDVVQYDDHGRIRFSGHGRPGQTVRLYVNNKVLGDALADSHGLWSLSPSADLAPGLYQLRTDELARSGKVLARSEVPFARASLAQVLAPGQGVVQPGDCLWTIARHSYGHGVEYTAIYEENLDQIRDPARIYPGQAFHMPTADEAAHAPKPSALKTMQGHDWRRVRRAEGETSGG